MPVSEAVFGDLGRCASISRPNADAVFSTTTVGTNVRATDRATNAARGTGGVETIAVARGKAVRIAETLWVIAFSLLQRTISRCHSDIVSFPLDHAVVRVDGVAKSIV